MPIEFKPLPKEQYPNITWENESKKLFSGGEYCSATASMVRACKAMNDLMIEAIRNGRDPIKAIEASNDWLTHVLYTCNMNNFKKPE